MDSRWPEVEAIIARLAQSGEVIHTVTGKPNRIVSFEGGGLLVETDTGTNPVSIEDVRTCWETFESKRKITRDDVLNPGRRSAFMMAIFRLLPGVSEEGSRPTYLVLGDQPESGGEPPMPSDPLGHPAKDAVDRKERADAFGALSESPVPLRAAHETVPDRPGLYAIYGGAATWLDLGLGEPPDERPLYVGKAEASMVTRDLRTHFASGRTGQSTVRRSFAALLRDRLDLRATPRNPAKPERFANFGLASDGDVRLTAWMLDRLSIAVWPKTGGDPLEVVERLVLAAWLPPLNLKDVTTPWSARVKAARKLMTDEARASAETT